MGINRQGKRVERQQALKKSKYHKKEFYRTLNELEYIASVLYLEGIELTEDNIEEEVSKVSNITLGAMEKMILLNKQSKLQENEQD